MTDKQQTNNVCQYQQTLVWPCKSEEVFPKANTETQTDQSCDMGGSCLCIFIRLSLLCSKFLCLDFLWHGWWQKWDNQRKNNQMLELRHSESDCNTSEKKFIIKTSKADSGTLPYRPCCVFSWPWWLPTFGVPCFPFLWDILTGFVPL